VIDPQNVDAFYTIGFIDWTQAYKNAVGILSTEGITDDGVGNTKMSDSTCDALIEKNRALVEDGFASLTRAIELKPDYYDAMQYLQLTYRRHADFQCGEPKGLNDDL
jgi:hypothetical protein